MVEQSAPKQPLIESSLGEVSLALVNIETR
jgi:hypothetical protein